MTTRTTRPSGVGTAELAFPAVLAGTLLALFVFAWTWGALAAVTVGQAPPSGLLDAGAALLRLPANTSDPARAFRADGAGLPGPLVMWSAFCATIALAWTLVLIVGSRIAARSGSPRQRWARWARPRDLRALFVRPGQHGDRTALGTVAGRLIAAERQVSTIVIAPTRSGKTTGLMIPAILEHSGPVIATSVKGDLLATAAHRQTVGEVKVFDPTNATGWPSSGWSPVAASATWLGARRTADRLLRQAPQGSGGSHTDFWQGMGMRFLGPLLFAAGSCGASMRDVLRWVELIEQDEPRAALDTISDTADGFGALTSLESIWHEDHRIRGSVIQTVATALEAYQDSGVMAAAERHDVTADWLLDSDSRNTLFVVAPADDQERLQGVFAALLTDLIATAFARATEQGRPLDPVLQCVLDEAPYIARLPNLARVASTGAGEGIRLLTSAQTMSQLVERWGQAEAETIIAGHPSRIFGSGLSDPTSLSYLRTALGDEEVQTVSRRGGFSQLDRTHATTFRALVDGPTAREAERASAILVYGNLPPARLRLRPWFADRRLRGMIESGRLAVKSREEILP